ncbi:RHS repeat-associated core domain-containing protein [Leifsonia shinshuensis]|nr:RHS repeat-associated core domain-containing protein [Leifsonia shinshuensis]
MTGLTQLGARAYDPVLGRFLSVDPVLAPENPLQNNGYAYSANNPVTNSDPDGKCYVAGKDSMNFKANCGGGAGISAPQIPGQSQYVPQPGTFDDWAINSKGDSRTVSGRIPPPDSKLKIAEAPDMGVRMLGPDLRGEDAYGKWADKERKNKQREAARQKELEDAELKPGTGKCGAISGKAFAGLGGSSCDVRTLDGSSRAMRRSGSDSGLAPP